MYPLQAAGTTGGIRPAKKKISQFPEGYRASEVADGQADVERTETSQGLKHVDTGEQKAKQTATTDEPAACRPGTLLPPKAPYPLLSLQEQQDQEAMLQNQQAHALKTLKELKSQQAWLKHCLHVYSNSELL